MGLNRQIKHLFEGGEAFHRNVDLGLLGRQLGFQACNHLVALTKAVVELLAAGLRPISAPSCLTNCRYFRAIPTLSSSTRKPDVRKDNYGAVS